jgi:hypothetical protein
MKNKIENPRIGRKTKDAGKREKKKEKKKERTNFFDVVKVPRQIFF